MERVRLRAEHEAVKLQCAFQLKQADAKVLAKGHRDLQTMPPACAGPAR